MVALALENKVIQGRRMRVDTTVVETNIHYPTDSSLLGDGTRVLTRLMNKVTALAGETGTKMRDRMRSMQRNVMRIGRAARIKGERGRKALAVLYRKALATTGRVTAQAKRFSEEIAGGVKRSADFLKQAALYGLKREIDTMVERTAQVVRQAKARVFGGDTHVDGKIVSVFEPSTEVIRKGKASKPTEFGKMVKVQEAENQIVIDYEVYDKKPSDTELLVPAIERHEKLMGRTPELVAADN
jgi:transposase, IS5 family